MRSCFAGCFVAILIATSAKAVKPNIVLIVADDLGYRDLAVTIAELLRGQERVRMVRGHQQFRRCMRHHLKHANYQVPVN
ncbi:hypothetical protein ACFL2H_11470 [Planctomycetota bacterium]